MSLAVVNLTWLRFVWNNVKWWPLGRLRSLKVTDFATDRKSICDFLLVNNTKLYAVPRRFRVIAAHWSNYRSRQMVRVPLFYPSFGWTTPELRTAKFGLENQKHHCIVWYTKYFDTLNRLGVDHQCDRRTDRPTDGRRNRQNYDSTRAPLPGHTEITLWTENTRQFLSYRL